VTPVLQIVANTPIWVWVLLAYLLFIGIRALRPSTAPFGVGRTPPVGDGIDEDLREPDDTIVHHCRPSRDCPDLIRNGSSGDTMMNVEKSSSFGPRSGAMSRLARCQLPIEATCSSRAVNSECDWLRPLPWLGRDLTWPTSGS
jgi:hypothetical protein